MCVRRMREFLFFSPFYFFRISVYFSLCASYALTRVFCVYVCEGYAFIYICLVHMNCSAGFTLFFLFSCLFTYVSLVILIAVYDLCIILFIYLFIFMFVYICKPCAYELQCMIDAYASSSYMRMRSHIDVFCMCVLCA